MTEHSALKDSSQIADWFAMRVMELCDAELLEFDTTYHVGSISLGYTAPGITIEVSNSAGAVYVIEDGAGVLWLSYPSGRGQRSATVIASGSDIESLLQICVQTLAH